MDIHMPVMDGLEAASKIMRLGIKTPVVAITANIMPNDLELYRASGMADCLGKPFTSQELWKCLIKYLPVESYSAVDKQNRREEEEKSLRQLRLNFVKNNRDTYAEIIKAAEGGDIKLAHRLAHTLKGNAGLIEEESLRVAAAEAEALFSEGKNLLDVEKTTALEAELKSVLDKLSPLLHEEETNRKTEVADTEKAKKIIEKLEPMLVDRNPECVNLLDDIRTIPGTEALMQQMEKFKFKQAILELAKIKNGWE
jgi:CheY-like chemotaxis protein